jgi:hypothetical protein
MAGRTSASTGIIVTIVILTLLTLGFFVGFAVTLGKNSDLKRELASASANQSEIVGVERNRDDVRTLIAEATKSEQRTLVGYLVAQRDGLVQRISGDKRDTLASIEAKLQGAEGSEGSLLAMLSSRDTQLQGLTQQLATAEAARTQALEDLKNESNRIATITSQHAATLKQLNEQIGTMSGDNEAYRKAIEEYRAAMSAQNEGVRTASDESTRRLQDQINKLTEEKLVLEANLAKLRGERSKTAFRGDAESALVDGTIIGLNEADGSVTINLGRQQKMVLGMTFAVYGSPAAMKPDADGNIPAGKATLEVISVGDLTSVARVTRELRGNPVVRGDVIANAAYDPNKVYRFVVFGNFDTDRDGLPTVAERGEIESMIRGWGGEVTEDLQGDADFVVLGSRPVLPPRPGNDAPFEVVQEFTRRFRDVERYDALFTQAGNVGVEVLNENRLYTLIGKPPAPMRRRAGTP